MPLEQIKTVFMLTVTALGAFTSALWLSMVIWTFRDMRARSRDPFAQLFATLVVAILTLPGLLVYLILRPRETLAEGYQRELEDEALLQEIEDRPHCPGCEYPVREEWQVCPQCYTRLRKTCANCGKLMDLGWNLCPHCGESVRGTSAAAREDTARQAPPPPEPEEPEADTPPLPDRGHVSR